MCSADGGCAVCAAPFEVGVEDVSAGRACGLVGVDALDLLYLLCVVLFSFVPLGVADVSASI